MVPKGPGLRADLLWSLPTLPQWDWGLDHTQLQISKGLAHFRLQVSSQTSAAPLLPLMASCHAQRPVGGFVFILASREP